MSDDRDSPDEPLPSIVLTLLVNRMSAWIGYTSEGRQLLQDFRATIQAVVNLEGKIESLEDEVRELHYEVREANERDH